MPAQFNITIPTGPKTLAETHQPILDNFVQLDTQIGYDHVALTSATNNGKHKKLTLIDQVGDPAAVAGTGIIYTKTVGGALNAYYRYPTGQIVPLTGGGVTSWCDFTVGALGLQVINNNFNVVSVTRLVNNLFDIAFTNPLSVATYGVHVTSSRNDIFCGSGITRTINHFVITLSNAFNGMTVTASTIGG